MKVSIVTISFNQASFLPACIESVLGQNYENIEYIVVDAGSTDGSRDIIERYSSRISQVIFEPDEGPADGLNKGFRCATGDVFGCLNADDIMLPGAIRHVVESFMRAPATDVLCGNGFQIDEGGGLVRKIYSTSWSLRGYAYGACNVVQQATFFRREIFFKSGGFNQANRICWDGELLVDMALAGAKVTNTSEFLGGFRVYSGSITGSGEHQSQIYLNTTSRIAEKIMGRPLTKTDRILSLFYQFLKHARYPLATFHGGVWKMKRLFGF